MSNRRRRGGFYKGMNGSPTNGTLTDRAVTTGLLYNYLEYVSPADVDGIKRASVKINGDSIDAKPIPANQAATAQMYGRPTLVPKQNKPTALIAKYSPQDKLFPQLEKYGNSLLRSALRKIVDEV